MTNSDSNNPKKYQILTQDKLGGMDVDEFEADSNRILPSAYFPDFADRFVLPVPSSYGAIGKTVFLVGLGSLVSNVGLTSTIGFFAMSVAGIPFALILSLAWHSKETLRRPILLMLVPFLFGFSCGLFPSTLHQIIPEIEEKIENVEW